MLALAEQPAAAQVASIWGLASNPFDCWLAMRGLETLSIRMSKAMTNATALADWLAAQPGVSRVVYPGRPDHPQAAVVKKQMRGGSTLVAFEVANGKKGAFAFQDALKIVRISNNLGDAESLITHPATTTHYRLKPEQRAALGISDGMVRLSCGLEHRDDLIEDLMAALQAV